MVGAVSGRTLGPESRAPPVQGRRIGVSQSVVLSRFFTLALMFCLVDLVLSFQLSPRSTSPSRASSSTDTCSCLDAIRRKGFEIGGDGTEGEALEGEEGLLGSGRGGAVPIPAPRVAMEDAFENEVEEESAGTSRHEFLRSSFALAVGSLSASAVGAFGGGVEEARAQTAPGPDLSKLLANFTYLPVTYNGPTPLPYKQRWADDGMPAFPRQPAYQIIPQRPEPLMMPMSDEGEHKLLRKMLFDNNVLLVGEHHERNEDRLLFVCLLRRMRGIFKDLALGVEMVQMQFQDALDAYVRKDIEDDDAADEALLAATEWKRRWPWPFETYKDIFRFARSRGIPLVALNTPSEVQVKVQLLGLPGLQGDERRQCVPDGDGFFDMMQNTGFREYASEVIRAQFNWHRESGLLGTSPVMENFLAARMVWDETMATNAAKFVEQNPRRKLIVLAGSDHVKYGFGIQARLERIAKKFEIGPKTYDAFKVGSLMLNPTSEESLSENKHLRLALGVDLTRKFGYPLSEYIWFTPNIDPGRLSRLLNEEDGPLWISKKPPYKGGARINRRLYRDDGNAIIVD
uniref:Haem-binding uptake Tiki superfamily ChaN domain-containing protein n=1 Tax=Chromera velia CCMP2878 TaxID=1169474 RepID=A0A0G4HTJ1_9ALVE|eukprot:Cvel_1356.t1-p1 / transcript=Cvel_1356.t1 / gene=Cvel_1356 / organism=Chromera_velia_CCMP2878 / gene_product=hypothetical protein / transcript_product=hypothetical protein / location=Cvel_scaffold46:127980-135007(-) / protein_length=570 / sequence_SO=supercontig / SO=protein_coding / is_pseudo=false